MKTSTVVLIASLLLYSAILSTIYWQQVLTYLSRTTPKDPIPSNLVSNVTSNNRFIANNLTNDIPHGLWIGNMWIPPPPARLYTITEIKFVFRQHSVLFLGDSTARRAYATLFAILNSTSDTDISVSSLTKPLILNINKYKIKEPCQRHTIPKVPSWFNRNVCRTLRGTEHQYFDYAVTPCYKNIQQLISKDKNFTREYSLLVVAMGAWETRNNRECITQTDVFPQDTLSRFNKTLEVLNDIQSPSLSVIWRTAGFNNTAKLQNLTLETNRMAIEEIDRLASQQLLENNQQSNFTYVDWGSVVYPRSFGQRVKGDIPNHYGLEARMAFIQMLTNHLYEKQDW